MTTINKEFEVLIVEHEQHNSEVNARLSCIKRIKMKKTINKIKEMLKLKR